MVKHAQKICFQKPTNCFSVIYLKGSGDVRSSRPTELSSRCLFYGIDIEKNANPLSANPTKMVKHTQTIRDHFVGLALKSLNGRFLFW